MEAFYTYTVKTKCLYKNSLYREGNRAQFPGNPLAVPKHFLCDNAEVEAVRQKVRSGEIKPEEGLALLGGAPEPVVVTQPEEGLALSVEGGAPVTGPVRGPLPGPGRRGGR